MNELLSKNIAVIGAGNIGKILIERLLQAGLPHDHLVVCDADGPRAQSAAGQYDLRPVSLSDEGICGANLLLVAVPPKAILGLLCMLSRWLCPKEVELIISFAAGVPLDKLEEAAGGNIPVVRVMPNAPSLVGKGMNPVAYGKRVSVAGKALTGELLALLGETIVVEDSQMNACVGLSGAAMRSVLPALEGMIQAGEEAGLSPAEARRVAAQVTLGTAGLLLETDLTIDQIKALTPMQTVDEAAIARLYLEAARSAKEKIDELQKKIVA